MSDSENLTLGAFIAQVSATDFVDAGPRVAHLSRVQVVRIVQHMWKLMEAEKRALTRAMHENAVHDDCLAEAMLVLEADRVGEFSETESSATLDYIKAKLAELKGSNADKTTG